MIRETILELDRVVERDIKDLEAECYRQEGTHCQSIRSGHAHQQRSRSVDSRRHFRAPPPPPPPPVLAPPPPLPPRPHLASSRIAEERRLVEHRMHVDTMITTRTHSAPRLNLVQMETISPLRKLDTSRSGPIAMLYSIPPPPFSRSSSSSSLSTETTLRVSSPEPDDERNEPLKPLYITEIIVPAKPVAQVHRPIKATVVTITDKTEIERRNREIERLEFERRTLVTEKELLLKEIDRYKHQTRKSSAVVAIVLRSNCKLSRLAPKILPPRATTVNIQTSHEHTEQIHTHAKPSTREVSMQHIVEEEQPPPLPPKQRQQRDVAINHQTEYDEDEEKQTQLVRRKLDEIKTFYSERIHFLEERILEQEKDIEQLSQPKPQRHVNTQCQPTMHDRALVTDTFRSGLSLERVRTIFMLDFSLVRDVALTCHLQPTQAAPVARRDVNLQCHTDEFIQKRDVCMEAIAEVPTQRDVSIGVSLDVRPDRHFRDVGTHVNLDYKPEIRQRDVATMYTPEPIEKHDRSSNTALVQTRDFGSFANTM